MQSLEHLAVSGARTLALVCGALVLLWSTGALGHDIQGHMAQGYSGQYLWGHRIGAPLDSGKINCCLLDGDGDCRRVPVSHVEPVDGGFEVDGEFIPEAEVTLSPDGRWYKCQHDGQPSHCVFGTKAGG
jgi:hypothetical protein